jgi:hypothetical protein
LAIWWKLILSVDAQNSSRGRSGYQYVDPLIGTTNGGQNIYTQNAKAYADSRRPCFSRCNAAIRSVLVDGRLAHTDTL